MQIINRYKTDTLDRNNHEDWQISYNEDKNIIRIDKGSEFRIINATNFINQFINK